MPIKRLDKPRKPTGTLPVALPDAHFVAVDATDQSILRDLNVTHFDGAAVVIGEDMETTLSVSSHTLCLVARCIG